MGREKQTRGSPSSSCEQVAPYYCTECQASGKACYFANVYDSRTVRKVYSLGNHDGRHYVTQAACEWFKRRIFPKIFSHVFTS